MYKMIFWGIIQVLFVLNAAGQNQPLESPQQLLSEIAKSKPDTNRISLQLKLGSYYLFKPLSSTAKTAEREHNLDSALNLFNQALQLSINLHETDWQYIALSMFNGYNWVVPDSSKKTPIWTVTYGHQKGSMNKKADAWEKLAAASFKMDKLKNNVLVRIGYYQHARSLHLQNHELLEAAGNLSNIAHLRILIGQFVPAEKDLQQSLSEYAALGYKKLHYTYYMLVNLEYARGNYYRAISYCLQGIKHTTAGENKVVTSRFYWNAAMCNFAVKKYQEALVWIRKAVEIDGTPGAFRYLSVETLLALNKTDEALKTLNNLEKAKFRDATSWDTLNQYKYRALCYAQKNNTGLAVRYYLRALKIANKYYVVGPSWNIICDNGIAAVYLKAKQPAKAERYINDAALNLKNSKTPLYPDWWVDFYDNSYKYHFAIADYRVAIYDLQRRVKIQDSLFTADKDKQLAELNIQYQTAQQEQSIKQLHAQSVAQRVRLEKANLQRNITIGGILIMIVVSALFYRNYKQKQAANNIITHKNELLQHLLTEKEWLLKEVHHRVKNNLHSVICLLEAQAAYLEDDALKAIENSQHRIYTMSLIHQKLYQAEDVKTIDMKVYIPELVQYLRDSFDVPSQIHFRLNIEPVQFNPAQAIPLALIINEALTNSIKYAFPGYRGGEIIISLADNGNNYTLEITDNGIGMQKKPTAGGKTSLGLELMKGLVKEIRGEITIENSQGVRIIIAFGRDLLHDMDQLEVDYSISV